MPEEKQQPREYDAVIGGQAPPPKNMAVLGGIEGAKMRLNSPVEKVRLSAVAEAMKYGDAGLDLVIEALKDESELVKKAAVKSLWDLQETPRIKQALSECNFWSFFESLYVIQKAHLGLIRTLAITPDSKTLVSGSGDTTIKIWDLYSGQLIRTLKGHSQQIDSLAITPDGKTIVSGSWDCSIKVWDLRSGRLVRTLYGDSGKVCSVTVAPDGNTIIAIATNDNLNPHVLNPPASAAITSDGKTIVVGSDVNTYNIQLWNLHSGQLIRTLKGFIPPAERMNSYPYKRQDRVAVWDLPSGELIRTLTGSDPMSRMLITPDDRNVVITETNCYIRVWDLHSGEPIRTIDTGPGGMSHGIIAIAPNGSTIVDYFDFVGISLRDLHSGECLWGLRTELTYASAVAISSDGKSIVAGDTRGQLQVWRIKLL